jgi:hypothetical protein
MLIIREIESARQMREREKKRCLYTIIKFQTDKKLLTIDKWLLLEY